MNRNDQLLAFKASMHRVISTFKYVLRYKGPGGKSIFRTCYMAHSKSDQYALWYRRNRCHYKLSFPWNSKHEASRPSCYIWKGAGAFEKPNIDFKHKHIKKYMTLGRLVNVFLIISI